VGGETHFLRRCDCTAEVDSCGPGLSCLCNRCTVSCEEANSCAEFPGAECTDVGPGCDAPTPGRVCDVPCSNDADCRVLSSAHACEAGFCRTGPAVGAVAPLGCAPASVPATRVLIIGDNLFAGPNPVGLELNASARAAGFLEEGEQLRDTSSATNCALSYMGGGIAQQYAEGNADGTVRLVIMTGGGMDAVFGTCAEANAECPVLVSAAEAAQNLLARMATDGVEHVLYLFYADPSVPGQKARLDVLRALIEPICRDAAVPCQLLDLRPVFEGNYDAYVAPDGLTVLGAQATAGAAWTAVSACLATSG
jgi:hypothetical protein